MPGTISEDVVAVTTEQVVAPAGPSFHPRQTVDALQSMRNDALRAFKKAQAATERLRAKLAQLNAELRPEILARRAEELHEAEDTALVAAVRQAMDIAKAIGPQRRHYEQLAVLRRTKDHGLTAVRPDLAADAALKGLYAVEAAHAHLEERLAQLEDAAADGNLARLEAVRRELAASALTGELALKFQAIMKAVQVPESVEALRIIEETQSLGDHAEALYVETRYRGGKVDLSANSAARLSLVRRDRARGLDEDWLARALA